VVVDATAFGVVQHDLARLRGRGDLVNARLVEVYLEGAVRRALAREAASVGSGGIDGGSTRVLGGFEPNATLVDVPREGGETREPVLLGEDFAGVAEELEPAARRPVEFETALAGLEGLVGLRPVKEMVRRVLDSGTAPHLMLLGLAGTGKTTVATLMADVYAARGLVEPGRVVRCRPVHLAGRDRFDTEERVHGLVEQAVGGVLLVDEAHRLVTCPDVVTELRLAMAEHRDDLVVICAGDAEGFEAWLLDNPEFRGLFGEVVRFTEPTDRELLQMFQLHAERDLYTLDEELRLELLTRFGRMRESPDFAFGRTARELFEQTTARQAARLRGANVSAALVTRLSSRDLPESRFGRGF
jgi:SpoVK/Ycf46/Vps4 family AAA+-type ATPase